MMVMVSHSVVTSHINDYHSHDGDGEPFCCNQSYQQTIIHMMVMVSHSVVTSHINNYHSHDGDGEPLCCNQS